LSYFAAAAVADGCFLSVDVACQLVSVVRAFPSHVNNSVAVDNVFALSTFQLGSNSADFHEF
jgi:hypothetical protein